MSTFFYLFLPILFILFVIRLLFVLLHREKLLDQIWYTNHQDMLHTNEDVRDKTKWRLEEFEKVHFISLLLFFWKRCDSFYSKRLLESL